MQDFLNKTTCARCGDTIEAGAYRVVVAVAEWEESGDFRTSPERGHSYIVPFCDTCVATTSKLEIANRFKGRVEARAEDVLTHSPSNQDAAHRMITGRGEEKKNGKGGRRGGQVDACMSRFTEDGDGGDPISAADREANEFPADLDHERIGRDAYLQDLSRIEVKQGILRGYLASKRSRGMKKDVRKAVTLYVVERRNQTEIARQMGVKQPTVSRWINDALLEAQR